VIVTVPLGVLKKKLIAFDQENDIQQIHVPFGQSGYSALYTVQDVIEIVGILRVKHQRKNRY
jgi:hypothetical protein